MSGERALAHIEKIEAIYPIEGYDRVELATVLGWQVIVGKDDYKPGDLTIFVEIDSILPNWREEFEFLRKRKFRIKTIKMCGVVSQGICFKPETLLDKKYKVGDDVTELLEIKKYEPHPEKPQSQPKNTKQYPKWLTRYSWFRKLVFNKKDNRGFPRFISKTDETRIQNYPTVLNRKDLEFVVREKIDGQSGTFFLKKNKGGWFKKDTFEFGVCSRNMRRWVEDNSSYWSVARRYNIEEVLHDMILDYDFVAIQGECVAPDVQGNKYKVSEPDIYVFNIILPHMKVDCTVGETIMSFYEIKWCPMVDESFILPDTVNELLEYADGESKIHSILRDGVVFRNYKKSISFKAVSNQFLLKTGE